MVGAARHRELLEAPDLSQMLRAFWVPSRDRKGRGASLPTYRTGWGGPLGCCQIPAIGRFGHGEGTQKGK